MFQAIIVDRIDAGLIADTRSGGMALAGCTVCRRPTASWGTVITDAGELIRLRRTVDTEIADLLEAQRLAACPFSDIICPMSRAPRGRPNSGIGKGIAEDYLRSRGLNSQVNDRSMQNP